MEQKVSLYTTLGRITGETETQSDKPVVWVTFPGVAIELEEPDSDDANHYSVPVALADLEAAGMKPGFNICLTAIVNLAARKRSQVNPTDFQLLCNLTDEQINLTDINQGESNNGKDF